MATLVTQAITAAGIIPNTPTQISAWGTPDRISTADIGARGVYVEVANATGGSSEFRVGDSGVTPAGNPVALGYTAYTIATGTARRIFIGPANFDPDGLGAKVGAGTSAAAFTVSTFRY